MVGLVGKYIKQLIKTHIWKAWLQFHKIVLG